METLKDKAAKGFFWGALSNITMQVLNAVFGIVISNILGPKAFGIIGLLFIFAQVAVALQDSGFVIALLNKKDATRQEYNSVFWFNISMSACLYLVLFLCAPLIADFYDKPILVPLARYYFLCFFIASFNIVPRAILLRNLKQKELAIQGFVALLCSGTIGVVMALNDMAYWGLATQTITFNLLVVVMSWYLSKWKPSFDITFRPIREMFSFSAKMLITSIFEKINANMFSAILGKFYSEEEVGNYNQANKWNLMGASIITGMVEGVAQPVFVQVGDDRERLCRTFRKMLRFTCFVCFPTMFGLAFISHEFISITFRDEWLFAAHLLQMLCVAGAFLPIATLYFKLIISRGKSNIYMWNIIAQGCSILVSTLCVYYMIGDEGISFTGLGLSLAAIDLMVIFYVVITISWIAIWHFFLKREIGIPYTDAIKDITPFLGLAVSTMVITYFLTSAISNVYCLLAAKVIIAAIIYIGTLKLLGSVILNECIGYIFKKKGNSK